MRDGRYEDPCGISYESIRSRHVRVDIRGRDVCEKTSDASSLGGVLLSSSPSNDSSSIRLDFSAQRSIVN